MSFPPIEKRQGHHAVQYLRTVPIICLAPAPFVRDTWALTPMLVEDFRMVMVYLPQKGGGDFGGIELLSAVL